MATLKETRKEKRLRLLDKLALLENLPGNWDDKGASRISPRATGSYRGFLDAAPILKYDLTPTPTHKGGIKVDFTATYYNKKRDISFEFLQDGRMALGVDGATQTYPRFDKKRVEELFLVLY